MKLSNEVTLNCIASEEEFGLAPLDMLVVNGSIGRIH